MSFVALVPPIYYNAKQYQCACNGVTDDTTNLTNAITAASTAGGGIVFLPGFCAISTPITVPANVRLMSIGIGGGLKPLASFSGAQIVLVSGANAGVLDMQILFANTTYSSNPAANGIQVTGAQRVLLQNLFIQFINGWAVQSTATAGQANSNFDVRNVIGNSCAQGFHSLGVTGSGFTGQQRLSNCRMGSIQNGDAFLFEDVTDITASGLVGAVTAGTGNTLHIKGACSAIELSSLDMGPSPGPSTGATVLIETGTNGTPKQISFGPGIIEGGTPGLSINAGTQISFNGLDFSNNGTNGVTLSGACDGIIINACKFSSNGSTAGAGHYDLSTTTSGHVTVSQCQFMTAQGTGANQVANVINYSIGTVLVHGCEFSGSGFTSTNIFNGVPTAVVNCPGYGTVPVTPYALFDGDLGSNSTGVGATNTVYLVGMIIPTPVTLTNVRCGFGTVGGTGHYDTGIYDATGTNGAPNNLLAHAASTNTSLSTTNGVQTPALIAGSRALVGGNLPLEPGRYWLALWIDNATDLINRETSRANLGVVMSGTNAGPLPALASSITSLGNGTLKPLLIGLISGGWS